MLVPVKIELSEEHEVFCTDLANDRQGGAELNNRQPRNNTPNDHDAALDFHQLGTRGECGGYLYFKPCQWFLGRHHNRNGLPDIDDFIDIKTSRIRTLFVQVDDAPTWAYALATYEKPFVLLWGWCWGSEAKRPEFLRPSFGGRNDAYTIKLDNPILKPMDTLQTIQRERKRRPVELPNAYRCHCGAWACFGIGHSEMKGIQGRWFCGVHYRQHKDAQHGSAKGLPRANT
jgi:hypothetical protein